MCVWGFGWLRVCNLCEWVLVWRKCSVCACMCVCVVSVQSWWMDFLCMWMGEWVGKGLAIYVFFCTCVLCAVRIQMHGCILFCVHNWALLYFCSHVVFIILSEISVVVIVVSIIVSAIGIAGLAAGIAAVSCCVCIKRRKKTTGPVGGTQDHGESVLVLIKFPHLIILRVNYTTFALYLGTSPWYVYLRMYSSLMCYT